MASEEPASEGDWTLVLSEGETDIEPDQETKPQESSTTGDTEQKENVNQDMEPTTSKGGTKNGDQSEEQGKESPKDGSMSKDDGEEKDKIGTQKYGDIGDGQPTEEQNIKSSDQDMEVDEAIENKDIDFVKPTREESIDSDDTIDIDDVNEVEVKDANEEPSADDTNKDKVTAPDTDDNKVKSDNQASKQLSNIEESSELVSTGEDASLRTKKGDSGVPEGSPTEKKTDSFHSLDLPIQPMKEARRSRARQRSDGLPFERSPSVASNRSEDSSGTGSSKQRKRSESQLQQIDGQSGKRKKMVRPGFDFKPGFKLEAQDFNDKWYPAKIVEVDEEDNTLLIHFNGWNSRFDEWMNYKSERIRPAPRQETLPEQSFNVGDTVLARWSDTRYYQGKIREININGSYRVKFYDGLEKTVQAGNIREMPEELKPIVSPKGYGIGDEVLARWNDCRYYPAKILSIKKNGAFRVLFYDGIEKSVQPFNVREMSAELKAQDFFKQFKAQIKASEEKNRKREKRKREEAAGDEAADAAASAPTSPTAHQPKRRSFSPTPTQPKRTRHDSAESSKTVASSISVDKDVSPESVKSHKSVQQEDVASEVEYVVEKTVLRRGIGYYVNKYVYLKHRDTGTLITLRCQNVSRQCPAKGYIKKESGKAVIRGIRHNHGPPALKSIIFCTTEDDALIPAQRPEEDSTVMEDVTPVSDMLPPAELEKIKERRKHIREHVLIDTSLGVLRDPLRLTAPKELIIDLDHNKYKCEVPECGKSFRKATLLEYHKKYYHVKPTTPSVTAAAASKVLSKSKKRLSSSPTKPSSRRSSEETAATPAKVTRSQRSSAPSELGATSPTRPPMSPPLRSPSERRRSGDAQTRRRERSGEKSTESKMRITVDAKTGKIVETRTPARSPVSRTSDGKFTAPEGRSSRSMSAEGVDTKTSPATESRRRRPSAPERVRQPSGAASTVVKPKEVIVEIPALEQDVVASAKEPKGTTVVDKTPTKTPEELETVKSTEQEIKKEAVTSPDVMEVSATDSPQSKTVKASKEREKQARDGKSRSERAKLKHKKKHKHKHEKGKEERARDRHKAERRRKTSEKSKVSDAEGKEKSAKDDVKREAVDASKTDVQLEDGSGDAVITLEDDEFAEEEKELINCVCGYMEEEGFMLQCERCYCWQHGCCEGVNQSTAPKHYVCTFCRHPRGERVQSKYRYDQEWFNTGKLPTFKYISQDDIPDRSSTMLTTHNLMADVHTINEILHGLKHKMVILKNPNHPELGLWAHPWRHGEEWSYEGHPDLMDNSADLSNIDSSNMDTAPNSLNVSAQSLDTAPNSLNVSAQSFDGADRMDTDELPGPSGGTSHKGDKAADSAIDVGAESKTEIQQTTQAADEAKKDDGDKDKDTASTVKDVQTASDIESSSVKVKEGSECTILKNDDKSKVSSDGNDKSKQDQSEIDIISVVSPEETKSKPSEGSGQQVVKGSKPSEGSVFGLQAVKKSKLSDSLLPLHTDSAPSKEQSSPDTVSADVDKPGPSGLQQADIDKPGPSGLQSKAADDDKSTTSAGAQLASVDKPCSGSQVEQSSSSGVSQPADKSGPSELQSGQSISSGDSGPIGKPSSSSLQSDKSEVSGVQSTDTDKPGISALQSEQSCSLQGSGSKPANTDKSGIVQSGQPSPSEVPGSQPADKPGPSGVQSNQPSTSQSSGSANADKSDPSDQPSTSGLQSANIDKPGPSGLKPEDIPSTSGGGDFAMEVDVPAEDDSGQLGGDNQMNPTEVKVTGSSVWTSVQGSQTSNIPSTSATDVRRPNIPPPAVCQANLMEHIQTMHEELFDRLALIEEQIEALEITYAQKHGPATTPQLTSDQESVLLKRKMAVLLADLEKLSNIDLTNHN